MTVGRVTERMLEALRVGNAEGAAWWSTFANLGLVSQLREARKRGWIAVMPEPSYVRVRLYRTTDAGRAVLAEKSAEARKKSAPPA